MKGKRTFQTWCERITLKITLRFSRKLQPMVRQDDPICGDCGKPLSKHDYLASRDTYYCEPDASYEFSSSPRECDVMNIIEEAYPGIYEKASEIWCRKNGHV